MVTRYVRFINGYVTGQEHELKRSCLTAVDFLHGLSILRTRSTYYGMTISYIFMLVIQSATTYAYTFYIFDTYRRQFDLDNPKFNLYVFLSVFNFSLEQNLALSVQND